jgi:hypothetical protein
VANKYASESQIGKNRMCWRKQRFGTRASVAANIVARRSRWPLRGYRCPHCGGWHITGQPKLRVGA